MVKMSKTIIRNIRKLTVFGKNVYSSQTIA